MRVLRKGCDKTYRITCDICNSDLEYSERDTFYMKEKSKGGLRKTVSHFWKPDEHYINVCVNNYRCVKCPVCNHIIKRLTFDMGLDEMKWERED